MKKITKEQLAELSKKCLSNNINRTARIITRKFDEKSRMHGYRTTQVQTLFRIAYWEPVSIKTLALKADMDRTTALRNCQVLEKDGFITIKSGSDKRFRMVELTRKGWIAVNKSYHEWQNLQAEVEKLLGKDKLEKLVDMLRVTGIKLKE